MQIYHLINHSNIELGGAQKIVHKLFRTKIDSSCILAFDKITTAIETKRSSAFLCFLSIIRYIFNRDDGIFVVHHRAFLPLLLVLRAPAVFVCHSIFPNKNFILKFMTGFPCIAVSPAVESYLLSHNKRLDVEVIENGFDTNEAETRELSDDNVVRIGYVGRLDRVKGIDLLVDAFIKIQSSFPSTTIQLHIVGTGELSNDLKDKLSNANLSELAFFWGYQSDPFRLLRNMSFICTPSRFEGFGMVFYEALARDHIVLASDIPAFQANPDPLVFRFKPDSLIDLTNEIEKIINDKLYLKKLNRTRKQTTKTLDEMSKEYLEKISNISN